MVWMFPVFAFIAVVALVPPFIRLAPVLKLVDAPDGPQGRKRHDGVIPLIGGLIVFPVFIAVSVFAGYGVSAYWPLYTAIAMLLVLGAVDDKRHVRPAIKFFVQCLAAALVVVAGEAQLYQLGDMFGLGKIGLEFMALPFSWIAVVLLINAVNLMDGLDGLAAGYGAIALGWIAFGFFSAGDSVAALHIGIVIGALAGFLVYNMRHPLRRKACVFLGDAGSLSLGLTLAWFAIDVTKEPRAALVPISVAWILALPIFDICAQFYRRVRLGKHPFAPDRGHFHHHFVHAGVGDGRAVALILSLAFMFAGFGVLGYRFGVPQIVLTTGWIACLLAHMHISDKPARYVGFLQRVKASLR